MTVSAASGSWRNRNPKKSSYHSWSVAPCWAASCRSDSISSRVGMMSSVNIVNPLFETHEVFDAELVEDAHRTLDDLRRRDLAAQSPAVQSAPVDAEETRGPAGAEQRVRGFESGHEVSLCTGEVRAP